MGRYGSRTMFLRLIFYFLVVIFFLNLVMGALTFFYFKHTIQKREIERNQEMLNLSKQMVESTIQEIQRTAMAISNNIAVRRLLSVSSGSIDYTDAQSVIGLLEEKINSSDYLDSIYLYNPRMGKVIFNDGIIDLNQFWDSGIIKELSEGPPYARWIVPHEITSLGGALSRKVLTYALRVPEGLDSDDYIFINIKLQPFYQMNVAISDHSLNDVAIIDDQHVPIIYDDRSDRISTLDESMRSLNDAESEGWLIRKIDGTNMFITYVKSEYNGWLYVKATPMAIVFQASNLVLQVMGAILLFCLMVGAALVWMMSKRYYRPIYALVQGVTQGLSAGIPALGDGSVELRQRRTDDLALLRTTFDHLVEQREQVMVEIRQHEAILKDHFLLNLLLGRENDPEEVARSVDYYDLHFPEPHYRVLLLRPTPSRIDFPESRAFPEQPVTLQIRRAAEELLADGCGGAVVSVDRLRTALLVPAEGNSDEADRRAKQLAFAILEQMKRQIRIPVSVGIGEACSGLTDIHRSYNEAAEALLYEKIAGEGSIISIRDIRTDSGDAKEWIEFRQRIVHLTTELKLGSLSGSMEQMQSLIAAIRNNPDRNYRENQIMLSQLAYEMIMFLLGQGAGLQHLYAGDPFADFNRLESFDEMEIWLTDAVRSAVTCVNSKRENKNKELMEQIARYIEKHYMEEMTLQTVADKVYLNPQYFSKLFKESTGKTFLEFLTEVRLEAACRLLESGGYKIYEIAEKTGFGNKINLMRAFKKMYQMTPTDYRTRQIQVQQ